jgi:CheY-like chemotaxis protein
MEVSEGTPLRDKLQSIYEAGTRAAELTRRILAFSRPAQQVRKIIKAKPIVKEVLKLLRASLPSTIEIRESFASESSVLSEPAQIHQVVMNLCTNAGLAMRASGGVLEVVLSDVDLDAAFLSAFQGTVPGTYLRLAVRDTGVGMKREVLERIFDPFFTTRSSGEGTGMGLSVVHGIVRSHGGFITVRSEPGQGAEFAVHLPVAPDEGAAVPGIEPTPPRGTERILFVDDEQVQANVAREMLETFGYRVTAVSDSRKALAMFLSAPDAYDMVITDVTMPGIPGDALAGEILRERPDLPIIFCTGYSERISEPEAKSIGVRGFLLKPYSMRDIAFKIREILDGACGGK